MDNFCTSAASRPSIFVKTIASSSFRAPVAVVLLPGQPCLLMKHEVHLLSPLWKMHVSLDKQPAHHKQTITLPDQQSDGNSLCRGFG